jgi:ferredoxin
MCQGEAPSVFGFDEDADLVTVLEEHPDESVRSQVEAAVRYCPAMALAIEDSTVEEDR